MTKIKKETILQKCAITGETLDKCKYVEILPHVAPNLKNTDNILMLRLDLANMFNDNELIINYDGTIKPEIDCFKKIELTKGNIKYLKLRKSSRLYFL